MPDARVNTRAAIRAAAFRSTLRLFLRDSERIARASSLTPQRYLLLLLIKGAPDGSEQATIGDLTERLQLAQSTVTELVNRAESAGLISRETSQADARVVHLRLTDEGESRLAKAFTTLETDRKLLAKAFRDLET
jgi:DNA-binding MarR family transcriptional regulator